MAREAWLERVAIPPRQVHPIPAELGAEEGAAAYTETISPILPFDMVLLGMGEDGHTASLFPGHRHDPQALVVAVHNAPKPPADRVSLTPRALNRSRALLLLITGAGKRDALQRWRRGEELPVGGIRPEGTMELLLDRAADDE
jgi:6-phosphogluconolactonase